MFFPFKWTTHDDGTKEYSALMVKYVSWKTTKDISGNVVPTSTYKAYFFPDNQKGYETLRDEFLG